jgi:hypothetical protein
MNHRPLKRLPFQQRILLAIPTQPLSFDLLGGIKAGLSLSLQCLVNQPGDGELGVLEQQPKLPLCLRLMIWRFNP